MAKPVRKRLLAAGVALASALISTVPRPLLSQGSGGGAHAGRWETQYFYDQNDSTLTLTDFKFLSAQRGIASGFLVKRGVNFLLGDRDKTRPVLVITADGGKAWEQIPIKSVAESLFFLDETNGWMVSADGIWMTAEAGRSWKKISGVKNLSTVHFLSLMHGFAAGTGDRALETQDGGVTWKPVAWDTGVAPRDLKVVYRFIAFSDASNGMIGGEVAPAEEIGDDIPPRLQRPRKQLDAFLYTTDGGKTWHRSVNMMYGEMTRVSFLSRGGGLALLQYPQSYSWPSEIFMFHMGTDDGNELLFRAHERAITDVLAVSVGDSYAAGYQPPGEIHPSPVPGKVRILRSGDRKTWEEMPVDYRAVARQVWLASPQPDSVWAATDTGMILKLNSGGK